MKLTIGIGSSYKNLIYLLSFYIFFFRNIQTNFLFIQITLFVYNTRTYITDLYNFLYSRNKLLYKQFCMNHNENLICLILLSIFSLNLKRLRN